MKVNRAGNGAFVIKPQGKPVLVPGSDNRKPFKVSSDELDDVEDEGWLD